MYSASFYSHYDHSAPQNPLYFREDGSRIIEVDSNGNSIPSALECSFTCSKLRYSFSSLFNYLIPATWNCDGVERQGYINEFDLMTYCLQNSGEHHKNQLPEFPQERYSVFSNGKTSVDLRTDADISMVIENIRNSVGIGRKDRGITFIGPQGIQ